MFKLLERATLRATDVARPGSRVVRPDASASRDADAWTDIGRESALNESECYRDKWHGKRVRERRLTHSIHQDANQGEPKAQRHRPRKPVLRWLAHASGPTRTDDQHAQQ